MTDNLVFKTLSEVLMWITGTGGGAWLVVMWFVSWALEGTAFWQRLSSQVKTVIMLVSAGLLGAGGQVLLNNPEIVAMIDPYVRPFIYAVMIWLASQVAHGKNPLRYR